MSLRLTGVSSTDRLPASKLKVCVSVSVVLWFGLILIDSTVYKMKSAVNLFKSLGMESVDGSNFCRGICW